MSASIKLEQVMYFNAEHPKYRVEHLRLGSGKWTGPADYQGELIGEFSLHVPSKLTKIYLGNFWSASIEIHVGLGSWPVSQRELLVQKNFMNRITSVQGENKEQLVSFSQEDFEKVSDNFWDRIRITCKQPYRFHSCFGLSLLNLSGVPKFTPVVASNKSSNGTVNKEDLQAFMAEKCKTMFPKSTEKTLTPVKPKQTVRQPPSVVADKSSAEKQHSEDFKRKAASFLNNCRFEDQELAEVSNITFNNVRELWSREHKEDLSKEEKAILKKMSKRYLSDLVERLAQKIAKSNKLKKIQDAIEHSKRQRTGHQSSSSSSKSAISSSLLDWKNDYEKQQKNCRNALATADVNLHSDEEKENEKNLSRKSRKRSRTASVERARLSGWISKGSQDSQTSDDAQKQAIGGGGGNPVQGGTDKPQHIQGFKPAVLLKFPEEVLKSSGILVQTYNYKSNKDLPLKGGKILKVSKKVPVVFYKVGPRIFLVYEGKFYDPDVQAGHMDRLFKDFPPSRVQSNRISAEARKLLSSSIEDDPRTLSINIEDDLRADFDLDVVIDDSCGEKRSAEEASEVYEECPLCSEFFAVSIVQEHASDCNGAVSGAGKEDDLPASPPESLVPLETCPICGVSMDPAVLPEHAASCGSEPPSPASSQSGTPTYGRCPVCDRILPMADLTEHAAGCQGFELNGGNGLHVNILDSQRKCDFCEQLVPEYVMEEHVEDCPARGIRRRVVSDIERRNSLKRMRR